MWNSPTPPSPQQETAFLLPKFQGLEIILLLSGMCWTPPALGNAQHMLLQWCYGQMWPQYIKFHISVVLRVKGPLVPTGRGGAHLLCLLSWLADFRSGWFEAIHFLSIQRKGEVVEKGVEKSLLGHGYRSKLSWDRLGLEFTVCPPPQGNCLPEHSHPMVDVRSSSASSAGKEHSHRQLTQSSWNAVNLPLALALRYSNLWCSRALRWE